MAIEGFILKDKREYDIEKMKNDTRSIILNMGLHMKEYEDEYKEDGTFLYSYLRVYDDVAFNLDSEQWGDEDFDQGRSFSVTVYRTNGIFDYDELFDWVKKGGKYWRAISLYDVDNNEDLVFQFIYEYLKLNPKECFWIDADWVYTLEDMERLSKLPFNEMWCYRNPKEK